jgi:hypothetical protein
VYCYNSYWIVALHVVKFLHLLGDVVTDDFAGVNVELLPERLVQDENVLQTRQRSREINLDSGGVAEVFHAYIARELERRSKPNHAIGPRNMPNTCHFCEFVNGYFRFFKKRTYAL